MENIIKLFFLILFVIIVYNYSLYYFKYHKDTKKYYISYSNKKDVQHKRDSSDGGRGSDGGREKRISQIINNNCDEHECKNGSKCIETDTGYECLCVSKSGIDPDGTPFSGRTFSGRHCEFQNDQSQGVRVEFNIRQMRPPIVYNREPLFDTEDFQWNDFI
tara:strand:- start:100 stop:582 length:483 start_codon:yes stop_codon:yes gene_type:complete